MSVTWFIKMIMFYVFPISSFAAGIYLVVSFFYEDYTNNKKARAAEKQAECHKPINKDMGVKVKVKRRKYRNFYFPFEIVGYNVNCKYCVFNRACTMKSSRKEACKRYRERK